MTTMTEMLAQHAFFQGMDQKLIHVIAAKATQVSFGVGKYIMREGQNANTFYLILQGKVALEIAAMSQEKIVIDTVEPGEAMGWSWLIDPYEWLFSARVVESTQAIAIDGDFLRDQCDINPYLGYELMKRIVGVIAHRLQVTRIQLLDIYTAPQHKPFRGAK